jgi:xylose isomerase
MFGGNTMDKTFGLSNIEMYKAKADFAFELMHKLGIEYYCFHDVDIAPDGNTLAESELYLKQMTDYLLKLQKQYKIKLL